MCHLQVQVEPYTFLQKLYVINPDSRDSRKLAFYLISRVIDVNTQGNKADPWSTVPAKSKGGGKGRGMGKKFPHSPILHYEYIYGALLFNYSSPRRCACIMKYGAVRNFFRGMF